MTYCCTQHGTDNGTPDPNNPDDDTGLHEPASFYADCNARERNKGLFTADQNMNNRNQARSTRQNPNGGRSGAVTRSSLGWSLRRTMVL